MLQKLLKGLAKYKMVNEFIYARFEFSVALLILAITK